MLSIVLSFLLGTIPLGALLQETATYDIRARDSLLFGKGATSGSPYYDVIITRQPIAGVLFKLPYTKKGAKFSFDMHHRVPMTADFGPPAEYTTVIEVLTGGTISIGSFTMSDVIQAGEKFDEGIAKTSTSEIDKFVTPLRTKTVTLDIRPGPQSISIVGQSVLVTRGDTTTRIDTPGTRIATVSNFKFEPVTEVNPLKKTP